MIETPSILEHFYQSQRLAPQYEQMVCRWFEPLAEQLAAYQVGAGGTLLVGINGCQGSGKSTLAAVLTLLLAQKYQLKAVSLSIDDFYLSHNQRQQLAKDIHPLLATRGVPGTHNVAKMIETINGLKQGKPLRIPRFNKATDDPIPEKELSIQAGLYDIVFLEGWCVGIPPQRQEELIDPVNGLETKEDPTGVWRGYVNKQLMHSYQEVFNQLQIRIMLKAPSFDCVYRWRLEQEQKLAEGKANKQRIMSATEIERFIQHYQRLTEHALKMLPSLSNYVYQMDGQRNITGFVQPKRIAL